MAKRTDKSQIAGAVLLFWEKTMADEPVLIKATFFSHTNDDDKDHDTGIYINVRSNDGTMVIAHVNNADNSGDDGTQYKDGSDHQCDLSLDAPGLHKSACAGFRTHLWIHTHGNDTWKFNGRLVLYFSDGSNLSADLGNTELKNDGAAVDWVSG